MKSISTYSVVSAVIVSAVLYRIYHVHKTRESCESANTEFTQLQNDDLSYINSKIALLALVNQCPTTPKFIERYDEYLPTLVETLNACLDHVDLVEKLNSTMAELYEQRNQRGFVKKILYMDDVCENMTNIVEDYQAMIADMKFDHMDDVEFNYAYVCGAYD